MAGAFESVTRVAIEEIIRAHAKPSKFGFLLTPEGFRDLAGDIHQLLLTSRNLKTAGDRMISATAAPAPSPRERATTPRRS